MDLMLEGKVAVVTGAGSIGDPGIGAAIAQVLSREGCTVVVVDRDLEAAEYTVKAISARGKALAIRADVANEADCRAVFDQTMAALGRVDILVNNVGIEIRDDSIESWHQVMMTNSGSMVMLSARFLEVAKDGGSIVNIGSTSGLRPPRAGAVSYAMSKGAVFALTKSLAVRYGPKQVRVNCVCPGGPMTPMGIRLTLGANPTAEEIEGMKKLRREQNPLNRLGDAWDVAEAVAFIASGKARWITGVVLVVDGGRMLSAAIA